MSYASERAEKVAGLSEIAQDILPLVAMRERAGVREIAMLRPTLTQGQIRGAIREIRQAGL
jgi:hypothetical protein